MPTIIERAQREDIAAVLTLLERPGLPVDGADAMGEDVVVARRAGESWEPPAWRSTPVGLSYGRSWSTRVLKARGSDSGSLKQRVR